MAKRNTKDIAALQKEWTEKLKRSGFKDIEDSKGNLKQPNRRTIGFESRELIADFFRRVDHFLTENPRLPALHRLILRMWSDGKRIGEICIKCRRSNSQVRNIIRSYRNRLLGMH